MSHPCNSYDDVTLGVLRELGVTQGFRADLGEFSGRSALEYPRQDHANIMKAMGKR